MTGRPARTASRTMLAIATAVVALDQLTKWWAERALDDGHVVHVVWTLQLKLVRNPGTAFSLGRSLGPLLGVLAVVVVLILVRVGRMVSNTPTAVALGLVLGGAVGNLIDRIFRAGHGFFGGHVIDFIDLQWWPVFNVADSGIVVGGVLLALVAYRAEQPRTP